VRVALAVAAFGLVVTTAAEARACSCASYGSAAERVRRAPVAFVGRVVSRPLHWDLAHLLGGPTQTFAIESVYHGVADAEITVDVGGGCGLFEPLPVGARYLVWAYTPDAGEPRVTHCSPPVPAQSPRFAAAIVELGPGQPPGRPGWRHATRRLGTLTAILLALGLAFTVPLRARLGDTRTST
jgi:hypothetical protein